MTTDTTTAPVTRDDAIRVIAALRERFAADITTNSAPMAYEPGFHVDDAWSIAWEAGVDWVHNLPEVPGLFIEPVSTWLVAIYPAGA